MNFPAARVLGLLPGQPWNSPSFPLFGTALPYPYAMLGLARRLASSGAPPGVCFIRLMSISWVPSGQPGRFFFCSPMLKQLLDRLSFALLGFIFGSLLAVLLWVLYGHGFSLRHAARREWGELSLWIRYVGGGFALLGFLLMDRVGMPLAARPGRSMNTSPATSCPPKSPHGWRFQCSWEWAWGCGISWGEAGCRVLPGLFRLGGSCSCSRGLSPGPRP